MEGRDLAVGRNLAVSLAVVASTTFAAMTLYEVVKQWLFPAIAIWASHALTIVAATATATIAAYLALRTRDVLMERLLRETEQSRSIQTLLDAIPNPIFFKNRQDEYWGCNAAFETFFGRTRTGILGKNAFDLFPLEIAKKVRDSDLELLQTGIEQRHEVAAPHVDGSSRQIIYQKAVYRNRKNEIDGLVGIIIDITQLKEAQATISRQNDFLGALIDNLPVAIFTKDAKREFRFTLWNAQAEKIFGIKRDEIIGATEFDCFDKGAADCRRATDQQAMRENSIISVGSEKMNTRNGEIVARVIKVPLLDDDGEPDTLLEILEDITQQKKDEENLAHYRDQLEHLVKKRTAELEQSNALLSTEIRQRKEGERQIERLAYFDMLTDLPNRTLLRDRIAQAVQSAARNGWHIAVLAIDLDHFKNINDSLGHAIGDSLLQAVGKRLRALMREEDTIARIGGDEFVVLLPNLNNIESCSRVAEKVLADITEPYFIDRQELNITASVGISLFPENGADGLTLIRCADTALYEAKAAGRNGFAFFNPEMTKRAFDTLRIGNELRHAIDNDEFVLFYQPKIDMESGKIIGAEALIRWKHPERGLVFPLHFIAIAEETGMILPIGEWVLRTACRQNKAWQLAGLPTIDIAVNLSARQFSGDLIQQSTAAALRESGLEAQYLELEITESMVMQNTEKAIAIMHALKTIGVKLSIDDFGTGYSSLSYLKRFPIDKLKIDRSFVRDLGEDDGAAIVTAIIGLGKSLNLRVIAEGVETQEQLDFLRIGGCDEVQGYFFSKPIPAADFEALMRIQARLSDPAVASRAAGSAE